MASGLAGGAGYGAGAGGGLARGLRAAPGTAPGQAAAGPAVGGRPRARLPTPWRTRRQTGWIARSQAPSQLLVRGALQLALEESSKLSQFRSGQILDGGIDGRRMDVHPGGVRVLELHAGCRRRQNRPAARVLGVRRPVQPLLRRGYRWYYHRTIDEERRDVTGAHGANQQPRRDHGDDHGRRGRDRAEAAYPAPHPAGWARNRFRHDLVTHPRGEMLPEQRRWLRTAPRSRD